MPESDLPTASPSSDPNHASAGLPPPADPAEDVDPLLELQLRQVRGTILRLSHPAVLLGAPILFPSARRGMFAAFPSSLSTALVLAMELHLSFGAHALVIAACLWTLPPRRFMLLVARGFVFAYYGALCPCTLVIFVSIAYLFFDSLRK